MHPNFDLSAAHLRAQAAWSTANSTLLARTGKDYGRLVDTLGSAAAETLILREHPDLAEALNVTPCACGKCGAAGVRFFAHRWWAQEHVQRHPVTIVGLGLGYEVTIGDELCALEDGRGKVIPNHYDHRWTRATC